MAARLSVVMVHTAPPSSGAAKMAEMLVGELIGRPGIDLMLVGPIANLPADSTDRLTLESLVGDVAVLAWQSIADTIDHLQQIGFTGQRSAHAGDKTASVPGAKPATPPQRRIFGFDLNEFADARPVIEALQTLLKSRGIKTFTIGGIGTALPSLASPTSPSTPKVAKSTPIAKNPPRDSIRPKQGLIDNLDLDDLLDQLDQSDS